MADLVEGSLGGAMAKLTSANLLPDATDTTTRTMNGATQGAGTLSMESSVVGLAEVAKNALPSTRSGELAPAIGRVVPAELMLLVETLPGATQLAVVDEISPLDRRRLHGRRRQRDQGRRDLRRRDHLAGLDHGRTDQSRGSLTPCRTTC